MNIQTSTIGYPRIGEKREWKKALEGYWNGRISRDALDGELKRLRLQSIMKQHRAGVDLIPVGDFSTYDHVLDATILFGLEPERFRHVAAEDKAFAVARGTDAHVAGEMTKWFNTNYHYIVPELSDESSPSLQHNYLLEWFREAKEELGVVTKPTLVGPVTLVGLSKGAFDRSAFLKKLVPVYGTLLRELAEAGAPYIQLEEPALVLDDIDAAEVKWVYDALSLEAPDAQIWLQTYFGGVDDLVALYQLPVGVLGLDAVEGRESFLSQLEAKGFPSDKKLALGVIDGRNVWKAEEASVRALLEAVLRVTDESQLILQPASSLLHVPISLAHETELATSVRNKLAFADEKLSELVRFAKGEWQEADTRASAVPVAPVVDVPENRIPYAERKKAQEHFNLPLLPTTTIGSFPQTKELRQERRKWKSGETTDEFFSSYINEQIEKWISIQETLDLDVLVHGEFERNDMVEFFGEKLDGMAFTQNGWVQSYGSRCVKPPLIHDDIWWEEPMTVKETVYAQSLTNRPVKGMLTGPVTIAKWSFVRSDCPLEHVFLQLAHAIRQEVLSLEKEGIRMIQVDEPAFREGLPLKERDRGAYMKQAVRAFKVATSSVQPETQVHTHMCYSSFNDSLPLIQSMDADVISIEFSRSHGELLHAFSDHAYEKGIGLGIYDIHSPRVPAVPEMEEQLKKALNVLGPETFWVNPDCGLKTRNENETIAALSNMVKAAKSVRKQQGAVHERL